MEAMTTLSSPPLTTPISSTYKTPTHSKSKVNNFSIITTTKNHNNLIRNQRSISRITAINDVSTISDPSQVQLTWQIIVGTIAGFTPFVVAGIEFSKRIIAQRRCEECGGSGLVFKENDYYKCPRCGGFLPWQSWKRFFSG